MGQDLVYEFIYLFTQKRFSFTYQLVIDDKLPHFRFYFAVIYSAKYERALMLQVGKGGTEIMYRIDNISMRLA